jgi:hypothetical protein
MGFQYNGAQVQIQGSVDFQPTTRVTKFLTGIDGAGTGTVTLGTVPSGKKWTILQVHASISRGASGTGNNKLIIAGTDVAHMAVLGTSTNPQNPTLHLTGTYEVPIATLAATETIQHNWINTGGVFAYTIEYVEEDV